MGLDFALLDLDGTLADSGPGIVSCFALTLAEYGREAPEAQLRSLIGPPLAHSFSVLGFSGPALDEAVARYRVHYAREGVHAAVAFAGVDEALGALGARGLRLAVATAKREDFAQQMVSALGLADHFEAVVGAPRDGRHLPKARIVAEALERLGGPAPASGALVGDRHFDVEAARERGLEPVGVLWGYGSREELEEAGATRLLELPAELATLDGP